MPNFVWFLILIVISFTTFVYIQRKSRSKLINISTYFFIAGFSYIIDFIILVIFNAYQYKPNLVDLKWFDTIIGSISSQAIAIPTTAMMIGMFHLRFRWIILIVCLFMIIEELFLLVNVYEHNWWHTIYTGLFLTLGFLLTKRWHRLLHNPSKIIQFITLYMIITTFVHTVVFFLVLFVSPYQYTVGLYTDVVRDHIFGNALYLFIYTVFLTFIIVFRIQWQWIGGLIVLEWFSRYWLVSLSILHIAPFWRMEYFLLLTLFFVLTFRLIYIKLLNRSLLI